MHAEERGDRTITYLLEPSHPDTLRSRCSFLCGSSLHTVVKGNFEMFPEMNAHRKGNLIKMKPCNNTRAIHHHHHVFVCRKQITLILIKILFYLHLNYLCACWLFILQGGKNTICDAKTRVCVFCKFLIYYWKCGVRTWFYKHHEDYQTVCLWYNLLEIRWPESGAVHWPTTANEIGG